MASNAGDLVPEHSDARIEMRSDLDVAYWCHAFGIDDHELRRVVQRVGPRADAVARYLAHLREGGSHRIS